MTISSTDFIYLDSTLREEERAKNKECSREEEFTTLKRLLNSKYPTEEINNRNRVNLLRIVKEYNSNSEKIIKLNPHEKEVLFLLIIIYKIKN